MFATVNFMGEFDGSFQLFETRNWVPWVLIFPSYFPQGGESDTADYIDENSLNEKSYKSVRNRREEDKYGYYIDNNSVRDRNYENGIRVQGEKDKSRDIHWFSKISLKYIYEFHAQHREEYHILDRYSRYIFPILFLVFNGIYAIVAYVSVASADNSL